MNIYRGNRKKSLTFFGITSRALMLIAAVLLGISYISISINPAKAWFMTVFGLLFAPLFFLNVFLLIWAAVRRSRAIFIPLLALVPSIFIIGLYCQLPRKGRPQEGNVKIVSYNVGRFRLFSDSLNIRSPKDCADSVMAFLASQEPDIICMQEFAMYDANAVRSYLKSHFKGYSIEYYVYPTDNGCYGNVTLSRFPLKGKGKIDFEASSNLALYSDYEINGVTIRIYNCHFQSYSISLPHLVNAARDRQRLMDTEKKVKQSIVRRPRQVEMVIDDIESCKVESIVVGDFNDNPMSYTYYRLSKGRKDSFVEAGTGLCPTYSYLWPMLRIDYILYPEQYMATKHNVYNVRYSDHYPVVAELMI